MNSGQLMITGEPKMNIQHDTILAYVVSWKSLALHCAICLIELKANADS